MISIENIQLVQTSQVLYQCRYFHIYVKNDKKAVVSPKESIEVDKSKALLAVVIAIMLGGCGQMGSSPEE
ncbi:hypothetical protein P5F78_02755, partial [Shouchella clausii]|uniref:hypothetical protein n=1 Tax=Shouchella clausii TaxID=79880 RepID=UPI002E1B005F|nr:hypothetical protein [Shouchella clausii]